MDVWKALVREAKAASWSELCSNIQSNTQGKAAMDAVQALARPYHQPVDILPECEWGGAIAHIGESLNHLGDSLRSLRLCRLPLDVRLAWITTWTPTISNLGLTSARGGRHATAYHM